MLILLHPLLELGDSEEINRFFPMAHSDNGSDEFNEEIRELEQRGIEVVEEVDDESLNVGTIVILSKCYQSLQENVQWHILDLP